MTAKNIMNKDNKIYTIIFTFIFTFLFILILSLVYTLTKVKINNNQEKFQKMAILKAMNVAYESDEQIIQLYDTQISTSEYENRVIFETGSETEKVTAVLFQGQALWGTVVGVLAVNDSLTRIIGLDIISHSETPGLGGRIEEDWFKKQFRNEEILDNRIRFSSQGTGKGNFNSRDGLVDGITGASRTSESLEFMINNAIVFLEEYLKDKQ